MRCFRTAIKLLRVLVRDLKSRSRRRDFCVWILRNIPGDVGLELRRMYLTKQFRACGYLYCDEGARFRNIHKIALGDNVGIGENSFLQGAGGITIGDYVMLGPGVHIWSANHVYADPSIPVRLQGYQFQEVVIEDDVWVGANVFIMPGARIGKGCVISAGSVVGAKVIPPYSILAGNPARVIGTRGPTSERQKVPCS